ncbi:amidohydrolase family protein, partial [Thermoproteota archaeon]
MKVIGKSVELKVGKLIVGNGNVLENANIGIIDGKISEVSTQKLEKNYEVKFEYTNKYIMPGLIDAHAHIKRGPKHEEIEPSDEYIAIIGVENARKALMAGVTSLGEAGANRNQT